MPHIHSRTGMPSKIHFSRQVRFIFPTNSCSGDVFLDHSVVRILRQSLDLVGKNAAIIMCASYVRMRNGGRDQTQSCSLCMFPYVSPSYFLSAPLPHHNFPQKDFSVRELHDRRICKASY